MFREAKREQNIRLVHSAVKIKRHRNTRAAAQSSPSVTRQLENGDPGAVGLVKTLALGALLSLLSALCCLEMLESPEAGQSWGFCVPSTLGAFQIIQLLHLTSVSSFLSCFSPKP